MSDLTSNTLDNKTKTNWPLSRLLYWLIVAIAVGYAPLAINYMWRYFYPGTVQLQAMLTTAVVGHDYATGARSVDAVRAADYMHNRLILLMHTTLGGIALTLAMFQFSSRLRQRYAPAHRWMGRIYIVLMTLAMLGSLSFLVRTHPVPVWGGLAFDMQLWALALSTLASGWLALWAIRRRYVVMHQAWIGVNIALMLTAPLLRVFWIGIGPLWHKADLLGNLGAGSISLTIVAPGGAAIAFMLSRARLPAQRSAVPDRLVTGSLGIALLAAAGILVSVLHCRTLSANFPYTLLIIMHLVPLVGYSLLCWIGYTNARSKGQAFAVWQWHVLLIGAACVPIATNLAWWVGELVLTQSDAFLASTMIAAAVPIFLSFAVVADTVGRRTRSLRSR
ncbi:DUF2306 domain-containing protein [Collimonas sp. NPDC087041]|uniref:DUF2306 domain-containing protein n=1 Tax=Collimonas sp. NPDC087041 TaxID=3363960 RepID=UPI0038001A80